MASHAFMHCAPVVCAYRPVSVAPEVNVLAHGHPPSLCSLQTDGTVCTSGHRLLCTSHFVSTCNGVGAGASLFHPARAHAALVWTASHDTTLLISQHWPSSELQHATAPLCACTPWSVSRTAATSGTDRATHSFVQRWWHIRHDLVQKIYHGFPWTRKRPWLQHQRSTCCSCCWLL
jgi:hypothetical protein